MRRYSTELVLVALLCGSSACTAGAADAGAPSRAYSGAWLTPQEEAILRRSYLRCMTQEHSKAKYAQSRRTLELAYEYQLDDLTLRLTSRDIADAPKEVVRQMPYISCQWFKPGKSPQPPG